MGNAKTSLSYLWTEDDSSPKYIKEVLRRRKLRELHHPKVKEEFKMDYEMGTRLDRIEEMLFAIAKKLEMIEEEPTPKANKKRVG